MTPRTSPAAPLDSPNDTKTQQHARSGCPDNADLRTGERGERVTAEEALAPVAADYLVSLLDQLSLSEKVALIQGADFWATAEMPSIGLRAMTLSDGPSGVRGARWDERDPSLNLPSGSALAASWDVSVAYRYAAAAAFEARRKGVDVVLGPTINLHRSPLGGRHFECFSEDPELTAQLAAAYVRGLQDNGVAATPKHYIANDSETDRRTVNVEVSERALRELYLAPFERSVEAGAWAIMSSYNSVNGVPMSENDLLEAPLNSEWGFDGVVVSDWSGVTSLASIPAAQDLAMPGPAPAYDGILNAVKTGQLSEADIDRKVLRILRLAERVGALGDASATEPEYVDGRAFARHAATEGAVLLQNNGVLPLNPFGLQSVAVIGHNAREARTQGGGSATVVPKQIVSPLEALRTALPDARVTYSLGAVVQEGVAEIPLTQLTNPVSQIPGLRATFFNNEGVKLLSEDRFSTRLVWFHADAPLHEATQLVLETTYTAEEPGAVLLGFSGMIHGRLFVNERLLLDDRPTASGTHLGASFLSPPSTTRAVHLEAGESVALRAEFTIDSYATSRASLSLTFGIAPDTNHPEALIARAVDAARDADVAVVVVGTNSKVESEGHDRGDLNLPGHQDDLVRAVAAVNPHTVVVVNAGAPVVLPWASDVAAVLHGYFGGQEFGSAIADILTGLAEPGGRLPTTWPATLEGTPVTCVVPEGGMLDYSEGVHIGYRAWLRHSARPAYPFGHGLGYTTWSWDAATRKGDVLEVAITNQGERPGKQVVQVYAERVQTRIERPVRWLVGFAAVRADPGQTVQSRITIPDRRFSHWGKDGWECEPGAYTLHIGSSVTDTHLKADWWVE